MNKNILLVGLLFVGFIGVITVTKLLNPSTQPTSETPALESSAPPAAMHLSGEPLLQLQKQLQPDIISKGYVVRPEYKTAKLDTDITNFEATDDWAVGTLVFMPPKNSEGGPDSLFFVGKNTTQGWEVFIEDGSPEWRKVYLESASIFYPQETVEWLKENY